MSEKKVLLGKFIYDPNNYCITLDGNEVEPRLSPTEAKILEYLYNNNDRPIPRDELLKIAAGDRVVGDGIITQYIRSIRKALGDNAQRPKYIRTHQKEGYQFIGSVRETSDKRQFPYIYLLIPITLILIMTLFFGLESGKVDEKAELPVSITSLKGQERNGDTSPDGKYIVFLHKQPNQPYWNLVLKKKGWRKIFPAYRGRCKL